MKLRAFSKVKSVIACLIISSFTLFLNFSLVSNSVFAQKAESIPSGLGTVEKVYSGETPFPIYYIQNAHGSFEAQVHIARLTAHLVKTAGVKNVFTEGYEGAVPLDEFYPIEDAQLKEKVSRYFMDYLRLSGVQYAYLNRVQEFKLIGVDSTRAYLSNLEAYRKAARNRTLVAQDIGALLKEVRALGDRKYPKEIKEWLKLKTRFDAKRISLANYLSRIHFPLPVLKSEENIRQLNTRSFFQKLTDFENQFIDRILADDSETREVLQYQRGLELVSRLNGLSVTPDEFDQVQTLLPLLRTNLLAHFLAKHLVKTMVLKKEWETLIASAVSFYELAGKRDRVFIKNLGFDAPAVLVTGGFHKNAILDYFEKNKISYVLITPRITGEDPVHEARYDFLMSGGVYHFERTFVRPEVSFSAAEQLTQPALYQQGVPVEQIVMKQAARFAGRVEVSKAASLGKYSQSELTLGADYFEGRLKTEPIQWRFRPSHREDVQELDQIDMKARRELITFAVKSIIRGEGVFSILAAGASSRMNPREAPEEVKKLLGDHDLKSKAAVPVGIKDEKVYTFLGAFLTNIARLHEQISEKIGRVVKPTVLILSNDEYREELETELASHSGYGIERGQFFVFNQALGSQFIATAEDIRALYAKGKIDRARLEAALRLSENARREFFGGNRDASILEGEPAPLGHGEFLHQLVSSGKLLELIDRGHRWISVRNIDNTAATYDENWLVALGLFLKNQLDMQPEVSPRIKGQTGGALVIRLEDRNQQLAEDPQIAVSKHLNAEPDAQSYWFNDAVAIMTLKYVINLYKQAGQTDEQFIDEMRQASSDGLKEIAQRGKQKFPKLLDAKPAKKSDAVAQKIETNMWQSTGVEGTGSRVEAIGVMGVKNVAEDFDRAPTNEEKLRTARKMRMLATKQWEGPAESYEANKKFIGPILNHITESKFVPDDLDLELSQASSLGSVIKDREYFKAHPTLVIFKLGEWEYFGPEVQAEIITNLYEGTIRVLVTNLAEGSVLPQPLRQMSSRVLIVFGDLQGDRLTRIDAFRNGGWVVHLSEFLQSPHLVMDRLDLPQTQKSRIMFIRQPKNEKGVLSAVLYFAAGMTQYQTAFRLNGDGFWVPTALGRMLIEIMKDYLAQRVVAIAA